MDKLIVIISLGAMVFSMFMTAINWHLNNKTAELVEQCLRAIPEAERTAIKNVFNAGNSIINKLEELEAKRIGSC